MRRRPRILIIGDGGVPSGFARVVRSVFSHLWRRYEIHHLALGYLGDPHSERWPLYPAGAYGDPLGTNRIERLVTALQPDVAFVIHEPTVVAAWVKALAGCMPPARIVAYMAIESGPLPSQICDQMREVGRWVTYTEFARRQIAGTAPAAVVDVIPHGVDTGAFRPVAPTGTRGALASRRAARHALGLDHRRDTFIVLNANRNQGRKAIDATVAGFARFARDKPAGVRLYLHMGMRDVGWDIPELCRSFHISDRAIFATQDIRPPRVSDAQLNLVYNACDVGINTAMCEGWGMVSVEHAAAGAAQIVPRHTACAELWRDSAVLLEPALSVIHPPSLEEVFLFDPETVAAALQHLYEDRAALSAWREAGYANATQPEWSWGRIAKQWATVIDDRLAA